MSIRKKVKLGTLIALIILFLIVAVVFPNLGFVRKSIDAFSRSLKAMNPTLSGRTFLWQDIFSEKLSISPNLLAFGSSEYFDSSFGAADNVFIRILVNYGWPFLIPLLLLLIEVFLRWKSFPEVIRLSIVMFISYSITADVFHILHVMIPFWFSLGVYYNYKPLNTSTSGGLTMTAYRESIPVIEP